MSFKFIVTIDDVFQMRGGLTQATAYLIRRYGSLDDGISAGARIYPEWLSLPISAEHGSTGQSAGAGAEPAAASGFAAAVDSLSSSVWQGGRPC